MKSLTKTSIFTKSILFSLLFLLNVDTHAASYDVWFILRSSVTCKKGDIINFYTDFLQPTRVDIDGVIITSPTYKVAVSGFLVSYTISGSEKNFHMDRQGNDGNPTYWSGTFTITSSVGLNDPADLVKMLLYPNPASNVFKIDGLNNAELEIYDIKGQLIDSRHFVNEPVSLNIDHLYAGMYFVEIFADDKRMVLKLVKE